MGHISHVVWLPSWMFTAILGSFFIKVHHFGIGVGRAMAFKICCWFWSSDLNSAFEMGCSLPRAFLAWLCCCCFFCGSASCHQRKLSSLEGTAVIQTAVLCIILVHKVWRHQHSTWRVCSHSFKPSTTRPSKCRRIVNCFFCASKWCVLAPAFAFIFCTPSPVKLTWQVCLLSGQIQVP